MPLGVARAVIGSGIATSSLILSGIAGAVSEWDSQDSAPANPATQWNDLIGSNHLLEDGNGTGATHKTVGGRTWLDMGTGQMYDTNGAIVLPQPSTGAYFVFAGQSDALATQIFFGRDAFTTAAGASNSGVNLWTISDGAVRIAITGTDGQGTGTNLDIASAYSAATPFILQGSYNSTTLKLKINGNTPVTTGHSITAIGSKEIQFGARHANLTNAFVGDVAFAGYGTGFLSDTDMATIATRLNNRFTVF